MQTEMNKYKQNLKTSEDSIFSYGTKVAIIDHFMELVHVPKWWSVTTSKHINYVASEYGYEVVNHYK